MQRTDEQIVSAVLAGSRDAFEVLMRRYNQRLYRVVRGVLPGNEAEIEDVMQQAYVNAYMHLGQFAGRAMFSTWLTKIALYEAFARARKLGRTVSLDEPAGGDNEEVPVPPIRADDPDPERQAFVGELRSALESSIDGLPASYRTVFILREIEGMSTAETADALGIAEDAVKTRLHRAKRLLRGALFTRIGASTPEAFVLHASRCDRVVQRVFEQLAAQSLR